MAGIKHKAVKAHGEKGLATEWNDDHEITGNIDQDQNQFLNQVIENRADFPAGPVAGQIFYNKGPNIIYIYNGTAWIPYEPAIIKGIIPWSISGISFKGWRQGDQPSEDYFYTFGKLQADEDGCTFFAPASLPDGAIIIWAIVYGNINDETWELERIKLVDGTHQAMASENFNTQDNTISNAEIDNTNYAYFFKTSSLDTGDQIYGARIIYYL